MFFSDVKNFCLKCFILMIFLLKIFCGADSEIEYEPTFSIRQKKNLPKLI